MNPIWSDIFVLTSSYAKLSLLSFLVMPIVALWTKKSWEIQLQAKLAVIVLPSILIWSLGHLGWPVDSYIYLWMILTIMAVVSIYLWTSGRVSMPRWSKKEWLGVELILLAIMVGYGLVRGFTPNIDSLEKYMDWGFIVRYLTSGEVPTIDMWQAGSQINYYSFGHFMASLVVRMTGLPWSVAYNTLLAIWMMLTGAMTLLLGMKIGEYLGKRRILVGLLMTMAIILMGNSHGWWYWISKGTWDGYWYAEATRFIPFSIHEFPAYSFIVSDLHAHLLALPLVLALVAIYMSYNYERSKSLVMGGLLASIAMTNTWDVLILSILILVVESLKMIKRRGIGMKVMSGWIWVSIAALVLFLPWWSQFEKITYGVWLVEERSEIWRLVALWGGMILMVVMALISTSKMRLFMWALALTGLFCIVLPEIIYFKDIYPSHPRANTMFKFTFTGFGLWTVVIVSGVSQALNQKRGIIKILGVLGLVIMAGQMSWSIPGYSSFYDKMKNYKGIDGEVWISEELPFQSQAIKYLRNNNESGNIVEAVGDSYSKLNTISAFSGRPTIQGWRVHEWLWRGSYDVVKTREEVVRQVYEASDMDSAREILYEYDIRYIVMSNQEREKYLVEESLLTSLGEVVLSVNDEYLVRLRR
jgi:uncharacterized membrane protein